MSRLLRALFSVVLFLGSLTLAAREPVRIAIGEWPPYLAKDLPHYGVAAHIVEEAFNAAGLDVEFQFLPWGRVMVYVENGRFDTSILWVETEERSKSFLFSDVLLEGEAVFFYNEDNPLEWQTYQDLSTLHFGGLLSASYPWFEAAKAAGLDMQMELVTDERQNFSKLISGRIDAFSLDKLVGLHILQQDFANQRDQVGYDPKPIESWPYRLIFTKSDKGETLVEAFNRGLAIIKQQGVIDAYLENVGRGFYLPLPLDS